MKLVSKPFSVNKTTGEVVNVYQKQMDARKKKEDAAKKTIVQKLNLKPSGAVVMLSSKLGKYFRR